MGGMQGAFLAPVALIVAGVACVLGRVELAAIARTLVADLRYLASVRRWSRVAPYHTPRRRSGTLGASLSHPPCTMPTSNNRSTRSTPTSTTKDTTHG